MKRNNRQAIFLGKHQRSGAGTSPGRAGLFQRQTLAALLLGSVFAPAPFVTVTALTVAAAIAAVAPSPARANGGKGGTSGTGGAAGGAGGISSPDNNGGSGGAGTVANSGAGDTSGGGGGGAGMGLGGTGAWGRGGGGAGGEHGLVTSSGIISLGAIQGQAGGAGNDATNLDGGGGGGAGGYGVVYNTVSDTEVHGDFTGGAGGAGGNAGDYGSAGDGGDGGHGLYVTAANVGINVQSRLTGGAGGAGGNSRYAGSVGANGGAGGAGLVMTSDATVQVTNTGTITGGAGGAGGDSRQGGNGGAGGAGIRFDAGGFINAGGTISGGDGGTKGVGNPNARDGAGGAGIIGARLQINASAGTVSGGLSGDGVTRANAITFTGGVNTLALDDETNFIGNVVASSTNDTFQLYGDTDHTLDASRFGVQFLGFGNFRMDGSNTWTLTGTSTIEQNWIINTGTLAISSDDNLGLATGTLTLNGGALRNTAAMTSARAIVLGSGGTFQTDADLTLQGVITGGGGLNKTGAATLVLTGNNTYIGGTTISDGILSVSNDTNLGSNIGALQMGNGTLQNTATMTSAREIGISNSGTFQTDADLTLQGVISGVGALNKTGAGTLTLTGANTYSGGTTVSAGTLAANVTNGLGSASSTLTLDGGTLQAGSGGTLSQGLVLGDGNGTLSVDGGSLLDVEQGVSGSGGLTIQGQDAYVQLRGANTYMGTTTIGATNILFLINSGAAGSMAGDFVINGSLAIAGSRDLTLAGAISGAGVIMGSTGTLTLTGDSSAYTGQTALDSGTLEVDGKLNSNGNIPLGSDPAVWMTGSSRLTGTGTVGTTKLESGTTLAPGSGLQGVGHLTVNGSLALAQGSVLDFQFGAPGSNLGVPGTGDSVAVSGDLELDGAILKVTDSGMGPGVYNLFSYGGALVQNNDVLTLGSAPPNLALTVQMLTGDKRIDLVNSTGLTLNFWNANGLASGAQRGGGDGTWSATSANWTDMTGAIHLPMQPQPGFAIFGGAPGTVTVDTAAGTSPVRATGLQFTSNGYTLTGDTLTLVADAGRPAPVEISVGDGSAGSASWMTTIENVIDGVDGLNKTGDGTLVLTNANTYQGGTTISGGTLSISSEGNLGDSADTLTLNGGVLRVNGTSLTSLARDVVLGGNGGGFEVTDPLGTFTLTQSLSGSGGLIKRGDGDMLLTGENTYTGGTVIESGGLYIGMLGTAGSIVGNVLNNGRLGFLRSDNVTFAGDISGSGSVSQEGGTLTLTGNNTYTGGTMIVAGSTVQVGDGGTTGSIVGNVDNEGTLAFKRSDAYAFGGVISGSGALRQLGTGVLSLTGDSSAFVGSTEVAAGTLAVDGKLGGSLTVNSGATLAGTGVVGATTIGAVTIGTVTIGTGAILAPGNAATPIGTLTVNGDLTLAQGSAYHVDTDTTSGSTDKVHVTGTANLGGSVVHMGSDTNYAEAASYTILTADQGINGTFGSVSSNLAFLNPSLAYGAHDVNLVMQLKQVPGGSNGDGDTRPIRFADAALNGNQRAVANGLQSLPKSSDLYSRVLNLSNGAPPAVFKALSGESHASTVSTLQGVTDNVVSMPFDHLRANLDAGQVSGPPTAQLGTGDASALPRSAAKPVWAQVFGNWRTINGDDGISKVKESDGGLFVGADRGIGGGWRLGGALGYTGSHSSQKDLSSKADVDSYSATIYGGKAFVAGPGKINLTAGTAYTWSDIRSRRNIGVMGLDQTLKANYGASTGQVFTDLGYAVPLNDRVTLEPFAGAAYSDLRTRAFSESGGSAALNGKSNRNDVTTTTLGVRAKTVFTLNETEGHLHGTVGWRHAFGDVKPETTLAFNGSQPFTVQGAPIARDAAVLELGADLAMNKNTTIGLNYNGQFGSSNKQNAGSINVNWRF